MSFIALDFDGVICDSASETGASGWRTAAAIWPELFAGCPEASPEMVDAFCKVRPFLETGYQAVVMTRMLKEGRPLEDFRTRLLAVAGEIMAESGTTAEELVTRFGQTRDSWIRDDLQGWLHAHRYYPGTIAALQKMMKRHEVVILTTKQERFVKLLLQDQGVYFPPELIFGLERKRPKEDWLMDFQNAGKTDIHFVEDRLATLTRVAAVPGLEKVRLHYADWGYGTPAELEKAAADSRIEVLANAVFTSPGFPL